MAQIRMAVSEEERVGIYRFRYQVYVEEQKKNPRGTDHASKTLKDDIDDASSLYYVAEGDKITGTLRTTFGLPDSFPERLRRAFGFDYFLKTFPPETFSFSSRLMVAPERRNSGIAPELAMQTYRDGRSRGIQFNFIHAAPALVPLYEHLGHRRYTNNYMDEDAGFQVPMVLMVEDLAHLRRVHSPFYSLARTQGNDYRASLWFEQTFPDQSGFANTRLPDVDVSLDTAMKKVVERVSERMPFFQDLDAEELRTFFQMGYLHKARMGETILRKGDVVHAVFLPLDGVVELSGMYDPFPAQVSGTVETRGNGLPASNAHPSPTGLSPGSVFGETAFFNGALSLEQVVALTDIDLLVIPVSELIRSTRQSPGLMCKVLHGLACSLRAKCFPGRSPYTRALPVSV
jgi:predicted GNAT family N-acyltransferase